MRAIVLLGLVATLASSACSDETGILVNTTTRDGFTEPIDHLTYYIGTNAWDDPAYFVDDDPLPDVAVTGDLGDDPHRLMIRPDEGADPTELYAIGVIAYNSSGDQVGFGYLPEPVGFVKGSVTQWNIEIHGHDGDDFRGTRTDCLRWSVDGNTTSIGRDTDRDCDGQTEEEGDCNDEDPQQRAGGRERCNNGVDDNCDGEIDGVMPDGTRAEEVADGKDNNCDGICDGPDWPTLDNPEGRNSLDSDHDGFTEWGRYGVCSDSSEAYDCNTSTDLVFPGAWDLCDDNDTNCDGNYDEPTPCFVKETMAQRCVQGVRTCPDLGQTPTDCEPLEVDDETLTFGIGCNNFDQCVAEGIVNPGLCALQRLRMGSYTSTTCETFHSANSGHCSTTGEFLLFPPNGTDPQEQCTYQIIGPSTQQGYDLSLEPIDGGDEDVVVNECSVKMNFKTTDASANASILIGFKKADGEASVLRVVLANSMIPDGGSCDSIPSRLVCDQWATLSP